MIRPVSIAADLLSKSKRMAPLSIAALFFILLAFTSVMPFLTQTASASSSTVADNIDLVKRSSQELVDPINGQKFPGTIAWGTCKGKFVSQLKSIDFLNQQFGGDVQNLVNGYNQAPTQADKDDWVKQWLSTRANAVFLGLGLDGGNLARDVSDVEYIISGIGSTMPIIQFYAPNPIDTAKNPIDSSKPPKGDPDNVCDGLKMIPVSMARREWRGLETKIENGGYPWKYMTFTMSQASINSAPVTNLADGNASGTFSYQFYDGPPGQNNAGGWGSKTHQNTVMDGYPDFSGSGGTSSGLALDGQWVDAGTIRIPDLDSNGIYGGDVYKKLQWGGDQAGGSKAYYFLSTAASDTRTPLTWNESGGRRCGTPSNPNGGGPAGYNCTTGPGTGETNCVPFITIDADLDLNLSTGPNNTQLANTVKLQNNINKMNNSNISAALSDYNVDCSFKGNQTVSMNGNVASSQVWFYYSTVNDTLVPVWTASADNEATYMGSYTKNNTRWQGGDNGCAGTITGTPVRDVNTPFDIQWTLWDSNCKNTLGTINVKAIGGQVGEAASGVLTAPAGGGLPTDIDTSTEPRIGCDYFDNGLSWIICPFVRGAISLVSYLDGVINSLLTIPTQNLFNDSSDIGKAYHTAWAVFRTIALALIVIAGLVMVISQAAGMELLDAYTVRKILPRLLLVAIGITLSWQLLDFLITLSNDFGLGVRSIIYAPFSSFSGQLTQLTGGADFALILFGTGAFLGFGIIGLLSFVLTALLASIVAFALLVLREIIVVFCVISAPLALAAAILPNTQKLWKLWRDTFIGVLMVFVIISGFIAMGRVFSVISLSGNADGDVSHTVSQIIGVIAYFAPYFLIPAAFRMAGGAVANLAGIVNDRSRGMFDSLKNFRNNQRKQRGERWRNGSLYRNNRLTAPLNALGRRVGAAGSGAGIRAFTPGAAGRKAMAYYDAQSANQALEHNPLLQELANDDDANAVLGMSGGSMAGLEDAARDLFTDENGVYNAARANEAMAGARAVGVNRANALGAARTAMKNKARAFRHGNVRALERGVRRLARNREEFNSIGHTLAFFGRDNGRADLGGTQWVDYDRTNGSWQAARAAAPGDEMAQWDIMADQNMNNGFARTSVQAIVGGHTAQVEQAMQTLIRTITTSTQPEVREQAAITLNELQGNLPAGTSGEARDVINRYLYSDAGLRLVRGDPMLTIPQQLANIANAGGVGPGGAATGTGVGNQGRTYGGYDPTTGQQPFAPPPQQPQRPQWRPRRGQGGGGP